MSEKRLNDAHVLMLIGAVPGLVMTLALSLVYFDRFSGVIFLAWIYSPRIIVGPICERWYRIPNILLVVAGFLGPLILIFYVLVVFLRGILSAGRWLFKGT